MTFQQLAKIMEFHSIPEDVELMSDPGWDYGTANMDGVYCHRESNTLVFTQDEMDFNYADRDGWENVSFIGN